MAAFVWADTRNDALYLHFLYVNLYVTRGNG